MSQDQDDLLALKHRIGEKLLSKRLRQQVKMSATLFGEGRGRFHWENLHHVPRILNTSLKAIGALERGLKNTLDFRVDEIVTIFPELPEAFHDYCILHLSDLHLDGMIDKGYALGKILDGLKYDLCVMTGDFRFRTVSAYGETLKRMTELMKHINPVDGCFGVLGNHDFIEKVPGFEKIGIRILLNESVKLERNSTSIHLAGIDDPHFYGTHDVEKACPASSKDAFSILLAHSPEVVAEAAAARVNLYLCGHTHGGQICLPGSVPILTNSAGRRRFTSGRWKYKSVRGYTSRGTGTSTFPVRYFCPPEITIHRLQKK